MKDLVKQVPLLIALFLLGGAFALQHGNFLTLENLVNILQQITKNCHESRGTHGGNKVL